MSPVPVLAENSAPLYIYGSWTFRNLKFVPDIVQQKYTDHDCPSSDPIIGYHMGEHLFCAWREQVVKTKEGGIGLAGNIFQRAVNAFLRGTTYVM